MTISDDTAPVPQRTERTPSSAPALPAVYDRRVEAARATTTKRRWWLWAAAGVLALGLSALAYLQPWMPSVAEVGVEAVAPGPVSRVLAVNGQVASSVTVQVRPLVSGLLVEVRVAEGDVVQAGSVLARIDPATQAAMVRQAIAGLDAAIVAADNARSIHDRTEALGTNAARVALENAARDMQASVQEVARMSALLEQAQIQLARYTILAPIAGTVLSLGAEPGQTADPSTPLMTIADLGQLVVETDVDESYATQIRLGQPTALQLAGEAAVRAGRVSFVSQRVDAATGGLAVEVTPDEPLSAPVGLTVTANITVDDRASAITVPRAAVQRDSDGTAVFVFESETAQRRPVTVIDWPAARLIVTQGLAAGDLVISDATGIIEGLPVRVVP